MKIYTFSIRRTKAKGETPDDMQKWIHSRGFRVGIGIGAPLLAAAGLIFLFWYGNPFPCVFYELTGLYCPGCGSGRALNALLHLDILGALDYNVFFVLALPLVAYYLVKQYIRLVFGRDVLPIFSTSWRAYMVVMWSIVGYWILRNIPVFPFSVLAP